jgi:hypothetical protein
MIPTKQSLISKITKLQNKYQYTITPDTVIEDSDTIEILQEKLNHIRLLVITN